MRAPLTPLLVLLCALAAHGCFNPDILDGGFSCKDDGRCPEGFTCVDEGKQKVCRKQAGTTADAKISDGKQLPDGPAPEAAPPDGPVADLPPPLCPRMEQQVTANLIPGQHRFDLDLDASGDPHIIFVDKNATLRHALLWPKLITKEVRKKVTIAAAAMDRLGQLHVAFGDAENGGALRRDIRLKNGLWSGAKDVWAGKIESVDLDTLSDYIYGAATGTEGAKRKLFPFLIYFDKGEQKIVGKKCTQDPLVETATIGPVRVSQGPNRYGHASFQSDKVGSPGKLHVYAQQTACNHPVKTSGHVISSPRPVAIAMTLTKDKNKKDVHEAHLAFVESATSNNKLIYLPWDLSSSAGLPGSGLEVAMPVKATSVEMALTQTEQKLYVSFFTTGTKGALYWTTGDLSAGFKPSKVREGSGDETRLRVHKDKTSGKTTIHIAYRVGTTLYHACAEQ